jgi:hypothetical protein
MKSLASFRIEFAQIQAELSEFRIFLDTNQPLRERDQILPFFRSRKSLSAFVGGYNARILAFDLLAHELVLFGAYQCDLVVGDGQTRRFCLIELEDATPRSVFVKRRGRSTPEWSPRFEHGFSQIIDWFAIIEDQQGTELLKAIFGTERIQYTGLLVIGRRGDFDAAQYSRLVWRSENVRVGQIHLNCITYDDLYEDAWTRLESLRRLSGIATLK